MHTWSFVRGLLIGAGLMYLMDPDGGGRRRALVRDRGVGLWRDTKDFLTKAGRDLGNRLRGSAAELRSRLASGEAPDDVVVERVRAKLGRYVSHPHAIKVTSEQGRVTLTGPILRAETDHLLSAVRHVHGVGEVVSLLEEHDMSESVPALQGGSRAIGERPEWLQETWTPALRLFVGAVGFAALAYGAGVAVRARRAAEATAPDYAYLR